MAAGMEVEEKVFVALPEEFKAGRSTLSWAISNFRATGVTIVVVHVHSPPQMIPVMGGKFHASKLRPEQVSLFRQIEREKVERRLDEYVHRCSKMKVKCEKLVCEKEEVAEGLVELIALHGMTKLVMGAAADRHYSNVMKLKEPKSETAIAVMWKADPSCKIWFVCKEQLICTRGDDPPVRPAAAVLPWVHELDDDVLNLSLDHEQDDERLDFGFYDELREACRTAEVLMEKALGESSRCQKAEEELISSRQKAKESEDLYLKEVQQRKETEGNLAKANREIELLKHSVALLKSQQDETWDKLEEAIAENLVLEQSVVDLQDDLATEKYLLDLQQMKCAHLHHERDKAIREAEELRDQRKLIEAASLSVVLPSSGSVCDEDCTPSYFMCPILQDVMRDPQIAADGFTYEAEAIKNWLSSGRDTSPMTNLPLAHRELVPNLTLRSAIQEYLQRQQHPLS